MMQVYPSHPVFREFQRKLASNHSLSNLMGLPEKDPSVDALSEAIQKNEMFSMGSAFDPAAQNAMNPFTGEIFTVKTEIPEK